MSAQSRRYGIIQVIPWQLLWFLSVFMNIMNSSCLEQMLLRHIISLICCTPQRRTGQCHLGERSVSCVPKKGIPWIFVCFLSNFIYIFLFMNIIFLEVQSHFHNISFLFFFLFLNNNICLYVFLKFLTNIFMYRIRSIVCTTQKMTCEGYQGYHCVSLWSRYSLEHGIQ